MSEVSTLRLYVLRATYLFIAAGLGFVIGPGLIDSPANMEHMRGVVHALLGAVGLLALLGVRYPLRMLPLLFFELVWKAIWLLAIGLPLWSAGALDSATRATLSDCAFGVVLCVLVIPWGYAVRTYVRRPGDAWRPQAAPSMVHQPREIFASGPPDQESIQ